MVPAGSISSERLTSFSAEARRTTEPISSQAPVSAARSRNAATEGSSASGRARSSVARRRSPIMLVTSGVTISSAPAARARRMSAAAAATLAAGSWPEVNCTQAAVKVGLSFRPPGSG